MSKKYIKKLSGFTILKNKPVAIELVINRLNERPIFDKGTEVKLAKLKKIYQRIPRTKCLKCGKCCYWYIINSVHSIEYLNILRHITEKFMLDEISKFYAFAKVNLGMEQKYHSGNVKRPKNWRPCIFIDEQKKTCKIYKYRPLACRLYGLNYSNRKKSKIPCSKVILLDKKDKKLFRPNNINSLWKEIRELSNYFIFIPLEKTTDEISGRNRKNSLTGFTPKREISIIKAQDLNNWFLI